MIDAPYEVVIIGSGATGGVAALTFAEAGIRVLVIEAGPNLSPQKAIGTEPLNLINRIGGLVNRSKLIQSQHPGYWKTNPLLYANEIENPYTYPTNKPFMWTQGRQVGGRSLTWGGITLRLCEKDLKAARYDGYGPEWPISYTDLESHYSFLEKRLKVNGNNDGLDQLPDGEFICPLPLTAEENVFGEVVKNHFGYPFIHSRGFGAYDSSKHGSWPIYSSPGSTLAQAIKTGKVDILSEHIAERLIINKRQDKAKSVIVVNANDGSKKEISASLIVLCASTIQSLKILLNSEDKIDSKGLHDPSGILGHKIMDHISICRFFSIPENKVPDNKLSTHQSKLSGAGSFFIPFGTNLGKTSPRDFIRGYGIWGAINRFNIPRFLQKEPNKVTGFLISHGEVLPTISNKVSLTNKLDRWKIPIPHINVAWGDNEKKMAVHMSQTSEEIIDAAGGKSMQLDEIYNLPLLKTLSNQAIALKRDAPPPGYYIHEVGGAPMGEDENNSVLDRFNRLWRCKNVIVVDGACWPTSSWQSPTLTMMAIARRACLEAIRTKAF